MQSYKIYPVGFAANSYLVTADGKSAVAIDPAQPRVADLARARGLTVTHILLTPGEEPLALGADNLAVAFGVYAPGTFPRFTVDFTLRDGQEIELAGLKIRVIATPGHTAGGASYLIGDKLYTGDTLFAGDVGRSDLPTGSGARLVASVKKLYALEGDYTVCPGHGEDTTLEYERRNNGCVRC